MLLTDSARVGVLGSLHCYARPVAGPDWVAQGDDGALSPVTDAAADCITAALRLAAADPRNAAATTAILGGDETRLPARIQRSNEDRPTVPNELRALTLITVAVMIGKSSALTHPDVRKGDQRPLLAGTAVVYGLTLVITYDIDGPFDGPHRVTAGILPSTHQIPSGLLAHSRHRHRRHLIQAQTAQGAARHADRS